MALDIITDLNVLGDIDLNKKELQNAVIQVLSTKPGSPATGQIFYDSDVNQVQVYTGSAWEGLVTETVDTTAMTATTSILNASLVVGRDAHNQIDFSTDNQIKFKTNNETPVIIMKASGEIEATSLDISGDVDVDGTLETDALSIAGTTVSSTAAELNILDGVTSTAAELNILDGVTSTTAELNILDGVTSTTAELNIMDGVTSTTAELNVLDGITAVVGELNYLDLGSTAVGTAIASKAVVLDSNKDYTGIRNLTIAGLTTGTGRIIVDDTTDATSTTDGSLQTDGGLSVAKDAVIGDDLIMLSDSAAIAFGANKEVTLTHNHNTGLTLAHTATADGAGTTLTLQSAEAALTANEEIAALQFDPSDSDGTDGTAISARIAAIAEGTFSASNNSTRLEFQLGQSEAASTDTARMTLSSAGLLTITDDLVIKNGGTIGAANDTDLLTMGNGILTVAGEVSMTTLDIGGTNVSATAAELNILDGVTATASELNIMDGVTSTTAELNVLDGITAVVGELNALDLGSTAVGTAIASKAVILDSNKDYTGIRNLTITGDLVVEGETTTVNVTTTTTSNGVVFEGTTGDGHDGTLKSVVAGADVTYTLPNVTGHVALFAADPSTTTISSTPAELNILDGVTSTTAELNILDGVTSTTAELNILDGVTSTAAELNILDGVTSTTAELNILDGVTSTAAELNILDGVTATASEINLIDGGTARGTTAVADGDGILTNDGGTMRMTKVETFATYFAAECAGLREKAFVLNNSTSGVASSDNITYTVTHSLNTRNVMVEVIRNGANSGDYSTVLAEVKRNGDDTIQVVFASARTAGDYTVMIRAIG